MFTQLLLLLATAFLFCLILLVMRRRNARAQARADFTQFMTVINDWSDKFGDYQLTGQAISALGEHNDRVLVAEHTPQPGWIGSAKRRHYLAEYKQCLTRHHALLSENNGDESASNQAKDLEIAIQELGTHVDQTNN